MLFYRRNERFLAEQYLFEDTVNWGNHKQWGGGRSVMLAAIRLLFFMGVRRIYLLGVDLRMTRESKYHFEQERSTNAIQGNNRTYGLMMKRFEELQPHFAQHGLEVFNCNRDSALKVFPFVAFDEAVADCTRDMPQDPLTERTEGLYERKAEARARRKRKAAEAPPQPGTGPSVVLRAPRIIEVAERLEEEQLKDTGKEEFGVVVAGNREQEWMLEWWFRNYSAHNEAPVHFIDGGLSKECRAWCEEHGMVHKVEEELRHPHVLPAEAIRASGLKRALLMDLCCEVRGMLRPLAGAIENRILVARDRHPTGRYKRYFEPGTFFNAGVVGASSESDQIAHWLELARDRSLGFAGVQDSLNYALYSSAAEVLELPQRYNRLRLDGDEEDPVIMNWTGKHGAVLIRDQIAELKIGA